MLSHQPPYLSYSCDKPVNNIISDIIRILLETQSPSGRPVPGHVRPVHRHSGPKKCRPPSQISLLLVSIISACKMDVLTQVSIQLLRKNLTITHKKRKTSQQHKLSFYFLNLFPFFPPFFFPAKGLTEVVHHESFLIPISCCFLLGIFSFS